MRAYNPAGGYESSYPFLERIRHIEHVYPERALAARTRNPGLEIFGNLETERLGVVSMILRGLRHNFVVALLSDSFGI